MLLSAGLVCAALIVVVLPGRLVSYLIFAPREPVVATGKTVKQCIVTCKRLYIDEVYITAGQRDVDSTIMLVLLFGVPILFVLLCLPGWLADRIMGRRRRSLKELVNGAPPSSRPRSLQEIMRD